MTPERWSAIQSLFTAAAKLDAAERAAFLADSCRTDPSLRRAVEDLLAADERAGGTRGDAFIAGVIAAAAGRLASDAHAEASRLGAQVGPYRLVRELGRGGMGTVYLAERVDEQYRATVAVKFMRGALAAPEFAHRFRVERQILADLTHPNIAWLLDGGAAPDGTPYLVMEYVDGQPIDEWCEARAVGLPGRLALFLQVCAAVQHAHQALVVHRDLKPSNILVTADGAPKLVDFGIAKLVSADSAADPTATLALLTPAYAAPEQIRGGRITVATDVYALGGVLYRLLAGQTPLDLTNATPGEMGQRIAEEEPPPPSAAAAAAAGRYATWRGRLRGDLDTIVLKALRKEPDRRYASVEQLAEDIRRHLDGRPVLARPDSLRYRAGKFVSRHRTAVPATLGAVTLIAGLTAFYTLRLADERDRARVESTKATQVAAFLTRLFAVSNPEQSRGAEITARALLDSGRARIATALARQPEVRATLLQTMGEAYWKLGLYDTASAVTQDALRIRDSLFGREHTDVAHSLTILGSLVYERGRRDSAEALFEEALAIRRRVLPPLDTATALALNDLGWLAYERGDVTRADTLHREALAMRRAVRGTEHADVAESLNNLGAVSFEAGRYVEAESLFAAAYEMRRRVLGEQHPLVAASLLNLATAAEYGGRLEEAERRHRDALALARATRGPEHPDNATNFVNLGRVLRRLGRYDEAEPLLRDAVALDSRGRGADHPYVAYDLRALGALLAAKGDTVGARRVLEAAIAIYRRSDPSPGGGIGQALGELGALLVNADPRIAERRLTEALAVMARAFPAAHPAVVDAKIALGTALTDQRRFARAESLLVEAERTAAAHPAWGVERSATARRRLGELRERASTSSPPSPRSSSTLPARQR